MGKSHRDNRKARKKRGGLVKRHKRMKQLKKEIENKCYVCGQKCRKEKLVYEMCPKCWEKIKNE